MSRNLCRGPDPYGGPSLHIPLLGVKAKEIEDQSFFEQQTVVERESPIALAGAE